VETFSAPTRAWFGANFSKPTDVQRGGWARIARGQHALLLAPTGSGKTLAAFLYWIDRLGCAPDAKERRPGVRLLYVSPLKALVYDIERNLRAPLVGIARAAEAQPQAAFHTPRVAVRTGDTPQRERREQARDPAEILVTTPESLYLILGSAQRETFHSLEAIIVDEIHALAATKRGAHLAISLERAALLAEAGDPQRIGLSATAQPLGEVARYLGGDRSVDVVDTSQKPLLDLEIRVPVPDMTRPDVGAPARPRSDPAPEEETLSPDSVLPDLAARDAAESGNSLWPALYPALLDEIRSHRTTIVFTNSRGLCERLAQRLNELAGTEIARAHHGSVAHEQRRAIEDALKAGTLPCIVATSSLELGIDMGAVDLVLMVESPGAVARGLQRVGRAGHQVNAASRGRIFPKHRSDLLEATVVSRRMREGQVEPLRLPRNPIDVLAQQIVAMVSVEPWDLAELERTLRRSANFRELSREALCSVLEMLSGRYPSTEFAELWPRLTWDRDHDRLEARRGAKQLAAISGGTIPDRGLYAVHLGSDGPRIGELDEEMVHESRAGETLTLGASTWRIVEIGRDRVIVQPAPGEVGKLPFWRGEGPGRPIELGRALGAFSRELLEACGVATARELAGARERAEAWLRDGFQLDSWAARNLIDYLVEQADATEILPSDRTLVVERFRDELGDWRVCVLSPFGVRLHAPWALVIEAQLSAAAGYQVQSLWSDDGIVLRFADTEELPDLDALFPDPEAIEDLVVEQLANSALFAGQFRENAARALLLPRRRPGSRTPLWSQRLRAQNLLAVARQYPAFPMMLETYRSCLQDVFDLPGLRDLLAAVRRREIRVHDVETARASPFAASLVFAYTAVYLYQGDTPIAERRASALSLDRNLLRDLLGTEELRDLLDAEVIEAVEQELQGIAAGFRARHVDALHDALRRLGDLSLPELELRCEEDPGPWLETLSGTRRVLRIQIAGEPRWIVAEDAALYRDALGTVLPVGVPEALLEPAKRPLEQLVLRFARTRGPFVTRTAADRFGLLPAQVEPVLSGLESAGKLQAGDFHPQGLEPEWCEPDVLRRLRRRTLAKLRGEVAPVEAHLFARFLPRWHGIGGGGSGAPRLREALEQLEGLPLPFSELEQAILPARVADFDPRLLDELGALGQVVWLGRGALGERDGRIALYRRERVALLAEAPEPGALEPLQGALLEHLENRGASFFGELAGVATGANQREILDALWDLAWGGRVTNDTFAPLRALAARSERRGRRLPSASAAAGRWAAVSSLLTGDVHPTQRAHAQALNLLERYGVLSRDAFGVEAIPGGMSGVYPVLRAMEESGKVRRGHFVEELAGAQFAFAGAVDQLRAERSAEAAPGIAVAAVDPVNPYGSILPWPELNSATGRARRATGAQVVVVDGWPVFFLDRAGARVQTFALPAAADARDLHTRAALCLAAMRPGNRRRALRIDVIDDDPAPISPLRDVFLSVGFRAEYKSLVFDRYAPPAATKSAATH